MVTLFVVCAGAVIPTVKNSQKQAKDSQNRKNDHWCRNRYRSTKTVPTVYQSSKTVKDSQIAKMTIGVPIVTYLTSEWRVKRHVN